LDRSGFKRRKLVTFLDGLIFSLTLARYAHVASHEEWARADMLPTTGKSVELPSENPKARRNR
jgi:hypothetical protein